MTKSSFFKRKCERNTKKISYKRLYKHYISIKAKMKSLLRMMKIDKVDKKTLYKYY